MKQSTSISTFFHNVKRSFYALQVVFLTIAVPALAVLEMNHPKEKKENKIESHVAPAGGEKDLSHVYQLPTTTFRSK